MGQMGMNLPGGMRKRGTTMDVYTGLLFVAVVALAAACVMVFMNGSLVGKGGSAFGLHEADQSGRYTIQFAN